MLQCGYMQIDITVTLLIKIFCFFSLFWMSTYVKIKLQVGHKTIQTMKTNLTTKCPNKKKTSKKESWVYLQ